VESETETERAAAGAEMDLRQVQGGLVVGAAVLAWGVESETETERAEAGQKVQARRSCSHQETFLL
jgi:hypothetical protein